MDIQKFTAKSQESLQKAQELAVANGHQEIDVDHLTLIMVNQMDQLIEELMKVLN